MARTQRPDSDLSPSATIQSANENSQNRHGEILEAILGGIASGRLRAGDRLPTEAELSRTFSASRTTISKAMRELKHRGLLHRRRGGGTHVAQVAGPDDESSRPSRQGNRLALFAPFATPGSSGLGGSGSAGPNLGYTGGQIYTHLSSLASGRGDHLSLQALHPAGGDPLDWMLAAVDELVADRVKGVFYYPVELPQERSHYNQLVVDKMRSAGLAVVLVDRDIVTFPRRSNLDLITYDNRRGGYLVTDHLIRGGCKRIVFIGIPYASSSATDRMRGYSDAMDDHGLHFDRPMIRKAVIEDLSADFCRSLMQECKPDAIICKMDHYAAIVGRHLVQAGLRIGRDVLLAGFDDQPIAELLPVPLTTVRFPVGPFASVCYERLEKQMANPSLEDAGLTLMGVELVLRASTGDLAEGLVEPIQQAAGTTGLSVIGK